MCAKYQCTQKDCCDRGSEAEMKVEMIVTRSPRLRMADLHDLILSQVGSLSVHRITTSNIRVLDVSQTKRTTSVLIARELLNRGISTFSSVEPDDASAARTSVRLVLDFSLFDLADSREELYKILIAG